MYVVFVHIYMWDEGCMSSWCVHVGEGCMSSWCVHVWEGVRRLGAYICGMRGTCCLCAYMWGVCRLGAYMWGEGVCRLGAYRGVHVVLVRTCGGGVYVHWKKGVLKFRVKSANF